MTFSGANTRQKRIKFFTYRDYLFTLLILEQVMNQGLRATRDSVMSSPPALPSPVGFAMSCATPATSVPKVASLSALISCSLAT